MIEFIFPISVYWIDGRLRILCLMSLKVNDKLSSSKRCLQTPEDHYPIADNAPVSEQIKSTSGDLIDINMTLIWCRC